MAEPRALHAEGCRLAVGTLLTTPYLFIYDMMVLAIPVAFLFRIGLKHGFRDYEFPALACALALFLTFTFTGEPTGFAITLIVGRLILRRAGPWWRREPVPSLAAAASAERRGAVPNHPFCVLSVRLNSCSVLHSDLCQIAKNNEEASSRPSPGRP